MNKPKVVVGLTGGAGSGKSIASELFSNLGIEIIDSDKIAHQLLLSDQTVCHAVISHFGNSILNPTGSIDRKKLQQQIFQDRNERKWLESLLHPIIIRKIHQLLTQTTTTYTIVVLPLLVETNYTQNLDRICVIDCAVATQLHRLTQHRKIPIDIAKKILQSQTTRKKRLEVADDIILNDTENKQTLKKKVKTLHYFYLDLITGGKMK